MRRFLTSAFLLGVSVLSTSAGLRGSDPSLWPGFPALENGDVNSDGDLDLSDPIYLLSYLYSGGPEPAPIACATAYSDLLNGDSNGDGDLDVSDPINLLSFLFSGGPGPVDACGLGDGGGGSAQNPRILPAHAHAYGKSLGAWTAAWWQWALALPFSAHPLFDSASCDAGQSGKVWFLGGAFTGTETTRECTVPYGKAILFPIVNVECSTVEPPPFFGGNEAELRECAAVFQDTAFGLSATIDGHDVANIDQYRVQSPVFDFTLPEDNIFGMPAGTSGQSVSDGVWILLAPLSRGSHTIHFEGSFPGFPIVVTYNITVE